MTALRRLLPQLRHASTAVASATAPAVKRSAPKVLDSTVRLTAIDEGSSQRLAIRGLIGHTLLKALVRNELIDGGAHRLEDDISACGGECEVNIPSEWLEKLPERTTEEVEILAKCVSKGQSLDVHSRLSCQIVLDRTLDGMPVAVPEPKPWRTN